MDADQYREINSYHDAGGEVISPITVTAWDIAIHFLEVGRATLAGLSFLVKAHNNRRVENKAVEMEMRADLEAILQ
jgi:hypothetical protein